MATPSRNDRMIKNLMKRRRKNIKEVKTEAKKQKDPEEIKKLLEMWQKAKDEEKKKKEDSSQRATN